MNSHRCILPLLLYFFVISCCECSILVQALSRCDKSIRGFPREYIDTVRFHGIGPPKEKFQHTAKAFFSSHDDLQQRIISLITDEQEAIQLAMYLFTDRAIADALIHAHTKGIVIELVTDKECLEGSHTIVHYLYNAGIDVYVCSSVMHDKFVIFLKNEDCKPFVWTGSYNFTYQGRASNHENALLVNDNDIVTNYKNQFQLLKKQSDKLSRTEIVKRKKHKTKRSRKKR